MAHKELIGDGWKRQRLLKKQDIPTQEQVYQMARDYYNPRDKALFVLLYLTGGRLTEVIPCRRLKKNVYALETVTNKHGYPTKQVTKLSSGSPKVSKTEFKDHNYPGIMKKNITFSVLKGKEFMIVGMQNRKNPQFLWKNIPVPVKQEGHFIEMLKEYTDKLDDDMVLFPFGKTKARQIIADRNMNPHFLRDIRLTHMVMLYDFTPFQLVKYAGWKNSDPAERYVRLSMGDLLDKF